MSSSTSQIQFDADSDGQYEATLTPSGLALFNTAPSANLHVTGNCLVTKSLSIGTNSSQSNLHINGTMGFSCKNLSSDTLLSDDSIYLVDTSTGNTLLTLPYAGNYLGRHILIKKTSPNNKCIIQATGNIDAYSEVILENQTSLGYCNVIATDNYQWSILSISGNGDMLSSSNLIGWWKLDEASGSSVFSDSTGLGNDGTTSTLPSGNIGVTGPLSKAVSFDGVDDNIEIASTESMRLNNNWSISFWYKRLSFQNSNPGILKKGNASNADGYSFFYDTDGDLTFKRNGNTSLGINVIILDDVWVHIVVTHEGGSAKMYHNSSLEDTETPGYGTSVGGSQLKFGIGADFGNGVLDDVRFYNKALSQDEIDILYNLAK
ncbi:MAG: LamG domain-containing protein [Planctomycetes bacterium]|nr:LamG domain-containing protein [Planctomycetota bacterium]